MRKILLAILLFAAISCFSQSNIDSTNNENNEVAAADSINNRVKIEQDSLSNLVEQQKRKEEIQKETARGFDYILQMQKEQKAKQKKAAIIRIAIGIGFLIVLIIGLSRKKKKA